MSDKADPGDWDGGAGGSVEDALSKLAVESILAELDTAEEELRAAHEELRAQQEEIDRLLGAQRTAPGRQELLVSRLPVAVILATPGGEITSANEAAGGLLRAAPTSLRGTAMRTYIDAGDYPRVREAIHETTRTGDSQSLPCTLHPRSGPIQQIHLVLSGDTESVSDTSAKDRPGVCWLLQPLAETAETAETADASDTAYTADALPPRDDTVAVAEAFTRLVLLGPDGDHRRYLSEVADICQDVIGPAASVSINIGPPSEPDELASDHKLAQRMDALQIQAEHGPCQHAWEHAQIVSTNNLATDSRWPELADLAATEDAGSVLAIPVPVGEDEPLGVINAYATEQDAFADLDTHTGELLGSAVAAVIAQVNEHDRLTELADQLEAALASRAVIDQAKGIIIARYRCSPDEAFQRLVKVSRNNNVKVRNLAAILVEQTQRPPKTDNSK